MPRIRTSYTHPLRIDVIGIPGHPGSIGMTLCPGKNGPSFAFHRDWNRDLASDLMVIKAWRPKAVITLLEDHEFDRLHVRDLPRLVRESGMESGITCRSETVTRQATILIRDG